MSDAERAIGRLEGKMDLVLERVTKMEKKIDSLSLWKAAVGGAKSMLVSAISFIVSLIALLRG